VGIFFELRFWSFPSRVLPTSLLLIFVSLEGAFEPYLLCWIVNFFFLFVWGVVDDPCRRIPFWKVLRFCRVLLKNLLWVYIMPIFRLRFLSVFLLHQSSPQASRTPFFLGQFHTFSFFPNMSFRRRERTFAAHALPPTWMREDMQLP